jgi:hypothetical protein
MPKFYTVRVTADGDAWRGEVEARSKAEAAFLGGVAWRDDNPDAIMTAVEFRMSVE